jgi:hypothetical protein
MEGLWANWSTPWLLPFFFISFVIDLPIPLNSVIVFNTLTCASVISANGEKNLCCRGLGNIKNDFWIPVWYTDAAVG